MIKHQQKERKKKRVTEKLFYKIGEVSRITGVEAYVLRYWETEFSFLRPRKSRSGQRIYTKKDIDLIDQIKTLLYDERYTIEGVRKRLGEPHLEVVPAQKIEKQSVERDDLSHVKQTIDRLKKGLRSILKELK